MSDRMANELLFGVLAFQAQLITESALRAAVEELSGGSGDKTLADILVEQQSITPEVRAALEPLVAAHVRQHADDPEKSLAALSSVSTLVRDLWIKIDPDHTHAYHASSESAAAIKSAEEGSQSQRNRGSKSRRSVIDSETLERIDKQVDQYADEWDRHGCPRLDAFLAEWSGPHQDELFRQLLLLELHQLRMQQSCDITKEEYLKRFPQFEPVVREVFRGETMDDGSPRRFRILKEDLAHGGLGVIHLAQDRELGREVALKEILPGKEDVPSLKRRFRLEAEITGGLEHPGIVPIYSLGRYQDGRPFYAMRFIEGDNLQVAIQQFHSQARSASEGPAEPNATQTPTVAHPHSPASLFSTSNLQFRELLGRFVDVCQAIAYAHSRGVLHRDLKPGNVMLGKYGETLIIDWGLAKRLQKTPDSLPIIDNGSQESVSQPATAEHHDQTQAKTVLGDPRYMSPEQAAGKLDELGPATDVFSLGAILFELLTGRAPIGAEIPKEEEDRLRQAGELVIARVTRAQQGDFPAPRQLRPEVPAALEAICLKAMSFSAEARYESAQALAKDIERWLADEPVSAWREPISVRAVRLARRHRKAITAIGWLMPFVIAGSIVAFVQITAARDNAVTALGRETLATRAAESAEQQTRQANAELTKSDHSLRRSLAANLIDRAVLLHEPARDNRNCLLDLFQAFGTAPGDDPLRNSAALLMAARAQRNGIPLLHQEPITAIGCREKSGEILTATGSQVWFWDGVTGEPRGQRIIPEKDARVLAFAPDGSRAAFAVGTERKELRIWDIESIQTLDTAMRQAYQIHSVAFSSDGRRLVTASGDVYQPYGEACVWEVETGRAVTNPLPHPHNVTSAAFSPDGHRVVTGSSDGAARVWDIAKGSVVGEPIRHEAPPLEFPVNAVAFSPDGSRVATASFNSTVRVWDLETKRFVGSPLPHGLIARSLAFSPDGSRLVTGSLNHFATVWNIETSQLAFERLYHEGPIASVAFTSDGMRAITSSEDKSVRVWELYPTVPMRVAHEGSISSVAISPIGTQFVTASRDMTARMWDVTTCQPIGEPLRHQGGVRSVAFSSDGLRVATASDDKTVRVWETSTCREVMPPLQHELPVSFVTFSNDGRRIMTESWDEVENRVEARVWGSLTGKPIGNPFRVTRPVWSEKNSAFSPDGTMIAIATSSLEKTSTLNIEGSAEIEILDVETGRRIGNLLTTKNHSLLRFSRDGMRVLVGSSDLLNQRGEVKTWDALTGNPVGLPVQHFGLIRELAFSPDGSRAVTVTADLSHSKGEAWVWEVGTGRAVCGPLPHSNQVTSVSFSPDGTRIVTVTADIYAQTSVFRVWDVETGRPSGAPIEVDDESLNAAFNSDGTRLVTWGWRAPARVWDLQTMPTPPSQFDRWGEVLTSRRAKPDGELVALSQTEWLNAWKELSAAASDWLQDRRHRYLRQQRLWHLQQADQAERSQKWFAATFHLGRLLEVKGTDDASGIRRRRAIAFAEQGNWEAAISDLNELFRVGSGVPGDVFVRTLIFLAAGKREEFSSSFENLWSALSPNNDENVLRVLIEIGIVEPSAAKDLKNWPEVAERVTRKLGSETASGDTSFELYGSVLYRLGRLEEAAKTLDDAVKLHPEGGTVEGLLFLALADHDLNQHSDAEKYLSLAIAKIERALPRTGTSSDANILDELDVLRRNFATELDKIDELRRKFIDSQNSPETTATDRQPAADSGSKPLVDSPPTQEDAPMADTASPAKPSKSKSDWWTRARWQLLRTEAESKIKITTPMPTQSFKQPKK